MARSVHLTTDWSINMKKVWHLKRENHSSLGGPMGSGRTWTEKQWCFFRKKDMLKKAEKEARKSPWADQEGTIEDLRRFLSGKTNTTGIDLGSFGLFYDRIKVR